MPTYNLSNQIPRHATGTVGAKRRDGVLTQALVSTDVITARVIGFNRIREIWVRVPITVQPSGDALINGPVAISSTFRVYGT